MNKRRITILLSFCLIIVYNFQIKAQESQTFSLKEAQEYALKNNANVKNAKLDIEKAKKKIWETTAMGLPHVSAKVAYTYLPTVPEMSFATPYLINPVDAPGYGPEMISMGYQTIPMKLGVENSVTLDATISQLVFSGAYIVGLQASKVFKKLSQHSLEQSENDVKEEVANTYYMILAAEESLKILNQNHININKTLLELTELHKEGFVENTDVDQIKYTKITIANAEKALERQVQIAYRLLKFQMGIELDNLISLSEKLEDIVKEISIETLFNDNYDISNNPTYKLLQTQENLQMLNLKREKSMFLPTITAFYNHQEKSAKADFDFSMPNMFGANMSIPIFSFGERLSKVKQADIELEKTRNQRKMAIQGLRLEVEKAQISLRTAYEKFLNEKSNLELTKKIYDKTAIKYKEGISSSMDLTQASSQYLQAQSNYFNTVNELLNSKNKLENLLNKN